MGNPLLMVIFNSYVKLPEGNYLTQPTVPSVLHHTGEKWRNSELCHLRDAIWDLRPSSGSHGIPIQIHPQRGLAQFFGHRGDHHPGALGLPTHLGRARRLRSSGHRSVSSHALRDFKHTADLCMEDLEKIQKESCKEVNAIGNTNQVYIKSLFPLSESLGQESKCGGFSFCIVECCCQDHILPAVNLLQRNEEEKRPQWRK